MSSKTQNPASLIAFDTTGAVAALMDAGAAFPRGALLAELAYVLGTALESYLNARTSGAASLRYGSRLFYQLAMEGHGSVQDATGAGDRLGRIGSFDLREAVPEALVEAYRVWHEGVYQWARTESGKRLRQLQRKKAGRPYEEAAYAGEGLDAVRRFIQTVRSEVAPFCKDFVIHGSLSDMRRTAYSDLDTWMVVSRETLSAPEHLRELRRVLEGPLQAAMEFDPLQHHGIFTTTEWDLDFYLQARFPLVLLDTATSLMENPVLTFACAPDGVPRARALVRMARRIQDWSELPGTAYGLKMLTSQVMLLPALLCQLTHGYVYKPDAFDAVKSSFSDDAWHAVLAATELRSSWSTDADLGLIEQLDPHFLEHTRQLGREALDIAAALKIEDPLWDEIRLDSTGSHGPANDHPCLYTREEFEAVAREEGKTLAQIQGVHSVYFLGSIDAPVPGISDLDLMVVLEEDPARAPSAADAYLQMLSRHVNCPFSLGKYIKWHEEVIVSREELPVMRHLWVPEPKHGYGIEEHAGESGRVEKRIQPIVPKTILLFKEGTFQLLRLAELMRKPILPLRLALMRTYSVSYDIGIAREYFGFDMLEFEPFLERIDRLRKQWFAQTEPQRRSELGELVAYALAVIHRILAEVAIRLGQKGVVRVESLRDLAPFGQAAGEWSIRYENRPEGFDDVAAIADDGALILPIEALPLVYHCRPFQAFKPSLSRKALDAMLAPDYREPAAAVRHIIEKNLLLAHRLRPRMDGEMHEA